jgi:phosphopantothenoylcysteine decarboxylase/phosphopantothenate--cysteine ligase
MIIRLIPNPDILAWVARQSPKPLVVGFAAESEHVKAHAQAKLERKKLDLICANDISQPDIGFNSEQNKLILIDNKGQVKELDKATKIELARQIMQDVANRLHD